MSRLIRSVGQGLKKLGTDSRELISQRREEMRQRAEELYGEKPSTPKPRPNLDAVRFVPRGQGWIAVSMSDLGHRSIILSHEIWPPTRESRTIIAEGDPRPYDIPEDRPALRGLKASIGPNTNYRHPFAGVYISASSIKADLIPDLHMAPSLEFYQDIGRCVLEAAPEADRVWLFVQEGAPEAPLNGSEFTRSSLAPPPGPAQAT